MTAHADCADEARESCGSLYLLEAGHYPCSCPSQDEGCVQSGRSQCFSIKICRVASLGQDMFVHGQAKAPTGIYRRLVLRHSDLTIDVRRNTLADGAMGEAAHHEIEVLLPRY